jgi:hypothetical protein
MSEQQMIEWANFYGIEILPPEALDHQIIDKEGNILPFTMQNFADALGFPYYNDSDFDENDLSENLITPIQSIAFNKQTVSKFKSNNLLDNNVDAMVSLYHLAA